MTASLLPARPIYLEVEPDSIFAMIHEPPDGRVAETAVLICPPWGWDEVASYRSRGAWADRLAAAGHRTLRIDLPGAGDSAGTPAGPDRVGAWSRAIGAAAAWLATQPGTSRVAAVGLGSGGLMAGIAIADGAQIDDLILWAAPSSGRTFLREQRAFGALRQSRLGLAGDPSSTVLPDGWLEIGGFVLSAETIAGIAPLQLASMPLGRLQRALILERDGMGRDREVEAHLTRLGVAVETGPGNGWKDMVFHPEQYRPPVVVFDTVAAWLARAPSGQQSNVRKEPPRMEDRLESWEDGVRIRESTVRIHQPFGQLFGILGEPVAAPQATICAIFLNAGAVRRIGPNRMWVEASRRWNAAGVPTIRMDFEGLGDADGDPRRYLDVGNFYTPEFGAQVSATIDHLEGHGFGRRFVLIGLCAGGYWAFHTAAADPRVVAALVVNPRAMVWDDGLLERREARKVGRILEPAHWHRILRGDIPVSRLVGVSKAFARTAAGAAMRLPRRFDPGRSDVAPEDPTERRLDALRDHGSRVALAFSGDEPVRDELEADGILSRLDRWPNVVLKDLPGQDHTLRPIEAQRAMHDLLDGELERLLGGGEG